MKRYFCDCCKTEVNNSSELENVDIFSWGGFKEYEVCKKCLNKFKAAVEETFCKIYNESNEKRES